MNVKSKKTTQAGSAGPRSRPPSTSARLLLLAATACLCACSNSSDQVAFSNSTTAPTFTPPFLVTATSGTNRLAGLGDGQNINVTPLSTWILRSFYTGLGKDPEEAFSSFGTVPHPRLSDLRRGLYGSLTTASASFGVPSGFDALSSRFRVGSSPFDQELDGLTVVSSTQLAFQAPGGNSVSLSLTPAASGGGVVFTGTETRGDSRLPLSFTVSPETSSARSAPQVIRGTVAIGAPLQGATVSVVDSVGRPVGNTTTDANGNYSLTLASGTPSAQVSAVDTDSTVGNLSFPPVRLLQSGANVLAVGTNSFQQVGTTSAQTAPAPITTAATFGIYFYTGATLGYNLYDATNLSAAPSFQALSFTPGSVTAASQGQVFFTDGATVHGFSIRNDGKLAQRGTLNLSTPVNAMATSGGNLYVASGTTLQGFFAQPDGQFPPLTGNLTLPGTCQSMAVAEDSLFLATTTGTVQQYLINPDGSLQLNSTFDTLLTAPVGFAGAGSYAYLIGPVTIGPPGAQHTDTGLQPFRLGDDGQVTTAGPFVRAGQALSILGQPTGSAYVGLSSDATTGVVVEGDPKP